MPCYNPAGLPHPQPRPGARHRARPGSWPRWSCWPSAWFFRGVGPFRAEVVAGPSAPTAPPSWSTPRVVNEGERQGRARCRITGLGPDEELRNSEVRLSPTVPGNSSVPVPAARRRPRRRPRPPRQLCLTSADRPSRTRRAPMTEQAAIERALAAASEATTRFLRGLPERPVARHRGGPRSCEPGWVGRCPTAPATPPRSSSNSPSWPTTGSSPRRRAALLLLRVRGRGQPPGRPGRRLAGGGVGPERWPVRARPGRGHRRGRGRRVAHRPARRGQHRVRHRRADGQRHRPGRGPPPRARRRRLGRGTRRPGRGAAGPGRGRGRAASPSTPPCASSAWAPGGSRPSPPTARAAWTPPWPRHAAGPGPTIVCAQAGNVNTGAVDPLAAICATAPTTAPGCTWTGRSGCGRQPARPGGTWSPGSSRPTRWPPTPTSG